MNPINLIWNAAFLSISSRCCTILKINPPQNSAHHILHYGFNYGIIIKCYVGVRFLASISLLVEHVEERPYLRAGLGFNPPQSFFLKCVICRK